MASPPDTTGAALCRREVMTMADLKLILRFKMDEEPEWRVKAAARISVAGGRLTLQAHDSRACETIPLSRVHSLSIQSVHACR
jgi:hypothetical protein